MSRLYESVVDHRGHKYIKLKSGRLLGFWQALGLAERAYTDLSRAASRAYKLAVANPDPEMRAYDLERVEWFVESIESWVGAMKQAIEKQRGTQTARERIALLRNTAGRTPEEAAAYRRKADELEATLGEVA